MNEVCKHDWRFNPADPSFGREPTTQVRCASCDARDEWATYIGPVWADPWYWPKASY